MPRSLSLECRQGIMDIASQGKAPCRMPLCSGLCLMPASSWPIHMSVGRSPIGGIPSVDAFDIGLGGAMQDQRTEPIDIKPIFLFGNVLLCRIETFLLRHLNASCDKGTYRCRSNLSRGQTPTLSKGGGIE